MPPSPPDLRRLAEALDAVGARVVLVGGMAAVAHGASTLTFDIDLAFAPAPRELDVLVEALRPLDPRPAHLPDDAPFVWDRFFLAGRWVRVRTTAGVLDLMRRLPGVDSFEGLYARSVPLDLGGATLRVASREDVIAMKEAAGRDKDLATARLLRGE